MLSRSKFQIASFFVALAILLMGHSGFFPSGLARGQEKPSDLSGFESSDLFSVDDNVQLDLDDSVLTQLIFQIQSASHDTVERFRRYSDAVVDDELASDPQASRFWVFRRKATATAVALHRLPDRLATPELDKFWLIQAQSGDDTYCLVSKEIPKAWGQSTELRAPIEMTGFFLGNKTVKPFIKADQSVPIFVCDGVNWFPDRVQEEMGIAESHVFLAENGVDLAAMDLVRSLQKQRFQTQENDVFYQMLLATREGAKQSNVMSDWEAIGFTEILSRPNEAMGRFVEVEGNVHRVVPVELSPELKRRYGVDRYYEFDMYVSLADLGPVVVNEEVPKKGAPGETVQKEVEYKDRFPLTVVMLDLPRDPEEYKHKRVRVQGFFYRLWNFHSEYSSQVSQSGQMSPLVFGMKPKVVVASTRLLDTILTVAGILFVVGLIGLIWYLRVSDRNSDSPLTRKDELPERVDLPSGL